MYLWKCWYDTRSAFLAFVGLVVAAGGFYHMVARDWLRWKSSGGLGLPGGAWEQGASSLLLLLLFLIPLAGFVLGALGVGSEFAKQTLPFLFTRPRSRRYFLWSSWAVGAGEALLLLAITIFVHGMRPAVASSQIRQYSVAVLLQAFVLVGVVSLLLYSITFFFTVLLRKEQHGTNAAVAAVFIYTAAAVAMNMLLEIKVPLFWELYSGALREDLAFPVAKVVVWLAVTLLLAIASGVLLERAES